MPAGAALAAFVVTLQGITDRPLWLDEAFTLGATNQLRETVTATAGTMSSYYALVTAWTAIVGDSRAALRLPSALLMAVAVGLTLAWARRILERHHLIVAAVALVLLPVLARYGQEARSYALVTTVTVVSWLCLTRAVAAAYDEDDHRAQRWWLALPLLALIGEAGHGLFALQVVTQATTLVALPKRWEHLRRFTPTLLAVVALAGLLARFGAGSVADWVPPLSVSQGIEALEVLTGPGLVAVALGLLVLVGVVALLRRPATDPVERWLRISVVAWALLPPLLLVALSTARPYLIGRYLVPSVPAWALLAAVGAGTVDSVVGGWRIGWRNSMIVVGPALVTMLLALALGQASVARDPGQQWDRAAAHVAAQSQAGDAILMPMPALRSPFEASWRELGSRPEDELRVLNGDRPLGDVRRLEDLWNRPAIEKALADHDRLWLVHATSQGWDDQQLELWLSILIQDHGFEVVTHDRYAGDVQVVLVARA